MFTFLFDDFIIPKNYYTMHNLDCKLLREKLLDHGIIFICYNANSIIQNY
jgi:hypothetical protein